ncbi:MAG: hypothetical protein K2G70_07920 [Turicibacter sp.]|nr:hypothetical protein [Turicibacter sp.]
MSEKKHQSHCGTCEHNINNYCMSQAGYYFYGEAISEEVVECEDWLKNQQAYPFLIQKKD